MKKTALVIIATAIAAFAFAPAAEARGHRGPSRHYVEYHRTCHGPAWVETYVAYYDRWGRPVFHTRVVPVRRVVRHHRYPVPPPVRYCPPPRSGVSVSFHYGR